MITKSEREALRLLWENEAPGDNWRTYLNEEQTALVLLWDLVRRDREDKAARDWWAARARKEAAS